MAVKEGEFSHWFSFSELDPDKLLKVLEGWDIQERIFATTYFTDQARVESIGWTMHDPQNLLTIDIDKMAQSVYIYDQSNSAFIRGIRSIGADMDLTLVGFIGSSDRAQLVKVSRYQYQVNYYLNNESVSPSFTWKIGQNLNGSKWENLDPLTYADYLTNKLREG